MLVNYIQRKQIDEKVVKSLLQTSFDLNQFTNDGPIKKKLEKLLHKKLSLGEEKSVVCLSNGTTACHALMYMYQSKFKKNIKWLIPSFTFPTPVIGKTNHKITDINCNSYTIDFSDKNLSEVDGIIITNLFGTNNQVKEWEDYCKNNGKILIFDNASSPLTKISGKNINEYGDSSFGSLHHTKYLGFGEGGFVVVPNGLYDQVNSIANFGFSMQRIHSPLSSNFKMSDVSAAYCYAQVENYDIEKHIKVQNKLIKKLSEGGLNIFNINSKDTEHVLGNIPILYERPTDISEFRSLGVEANKYYRPLKSMKNSNDLYSRIINLPLNENLTDYHIEILCKIAFRIASKTVK